ncbi:MAG: hypothetical protein K0Q49_25 [Haloplasmataceae bacterium]|nr:hypothetical protein [Haloplasmataceae bacterium]
MQSQQTQRGIFQKSFTVTNKNEQGYFVLKLGKFQLVVGIGILLVGLGLAVIPFIPGQLSDNPADNFPIFAFIAICILFGIYWTLKACNEQVLFNEEKLSVKNALGKVKELKWENVQKIEFKNSNKALFVVTENKKFKVLIAYESFYTIMVLISELFEKEMYQDALINVNQFYINNGVRIE